MRNVGSELYAVHVMPMREGGKRRRKGGRGRYGVRAVCVGGGGGRGGGEEGGGGEWGTGGWLAWWGFMCDKVCRGGVGWGGGLCVCVCVCECVCECEGI